MDILEDIVENESDEILAFRWNNAVKVAKKINNLLNKDFLIFDESGEHIKNNFEISEEGITLPISNSSKIGFFIKK